MLSAIVSKELHRYSCFLATLHAYFWHYSTICCLCQFVAPVCDITLKSWIVIDNWSKCRKTRKKLWNSRGDGEKNSATLPYLPIEDFKCLSMCESGNFVRIIRKRWCKSSCKIEEIVNQWLHCVLYQVSLISCPAFSSYTANEDTSHKRPAKFII